MFEVVNVGNVGDLVLLQVEFLEGGGQGKQAFVDAG